MKRNIDLSATIYSLFLLGYLIQISYLPQDYRIARYLYLALYAAGYAVGVLKIFWQFWNLRSIILCSGMLAIALGVYICGTNIGIDARIVLLNFVWIIICQKGSKLDSLVKADLIIRVCFTLLLIVLCKLGKMTNVVVQRETFRSRYAWGYSHPNTTGSVWFLIALYAMFIRRKKLSILDVGFEVIIALAIYIIPNSKTSVAGTFMVMLYSLYTIAQRILRKKGKHEWVKRLKLILFLSPTLITVMMFVLSMLYDPGNRTMLILNRLLTSRLEQGSKIIEYFKPTLFGNNYVRLSWEDALSMNRDTAIVGSDILYVHIYTTFGVAALVLFLFVMMQNMKYAAKNDICLLYCMVIFMTISCVENQYINIGSNLFLVTFQTYLYKSRMNTAKYLSRNDLLLLGG